MERELEDVSVEFSSMSELFWDAEEAVGEEEEEMESVGIRGVISRDRQSDGSGSGGRGEGCIVKFSNGPVTFPARVRSTTSYRGTRFEEQL